MCGAIVRPWREELNKQLDDHMKKYTDFSGFVLYPEGTRNIKPKALPLRRGMLKYTWQGAGVSILSFFLSSRILLYVLD